MLTETAGRSPADFGAWLSEGIRATLFAADISRAFIGARAYIGWHDTLVEDLVGVYRSVPKDVRSVFRAGVGAAFKALNFDVFQDAAIARQLMLLAARIQANQILAAFASHPYIEFNSAQGIKLLGLAVDITCDLASPGNRLVRKALNNLSKADAFDSIHARQALVALCVVEPHRLPYHLKNLHPKLQERYGPHACDQAQTPTIWGERSELVEKIFRLASNYPKALYVAITDYFERSNERKPAPYRSHAQISSDWWIVACLRDGGPLTELYLETASKYNNLPTAAILNRQDEPKKRVTKTQRDRVTGSCDEADIAAAMREEAQLELLS